MRTADGEEFREHKRARDAFWRRAEEEGVGPLVERCFKKEGATYLDPRPPAAFLVHGAGPGRWPVEVRAWPEWRRWLRARDRVVGAHLSLCHTLTARYLRKGADDDPGEHDQAADDFEEVWQAARILFVDRAIEMYDPDQIGEHTGRPVKFSTYAATWILNAVRTWRKMRVKRLCESVTLDASADGSEIVGGVGVWARSIDVDPEAALDGDPEVRRLALLDALT